MPEFVAKTESFSNPLPRSFLVTSLSDFAAGLDDELMLFPVRALSIYLNRTSSCSPLPLHLFLFPRSPSHSLSKNAIFFFLREVIHGASAARPEVGSVIAHSVGAPLPRRPFTRIGLLPVCSSLLPGMLILSLLLFISETFSTSSTGLHAWGLPWL